MSNRAYLYSTNVAPSTDAEQMRIVGLCEWSYDIPLAFKLLLSGKPQKCRSVIWDEPDAVALLGDYDQGVAKLMDFLERVPHPSVVKLRGEARQFLGMASNRNRYFLLEAGEIFDFDDESPDEQADKLLAELADLRPQMDKAIADLGARIHEEDHPPGFFARLFGARIPIRRENSNDMVYALGLGAWRNSLFYEPN